MQRLLQGDVGSGKTVVALYALLRAVESGRQAALMAPTEVLSEQHFLTIEGLCSELGVRVALLTSALGAKERANVRQLLASGDVQIVVGTHALIQQEVGSATSPSPSSTSSIASGSNSDLRSPRAAPARAPHDGDPDPADARAHGLRGSLRLGDLCPPPTGSRSSPPG